jgi:hypothetical protein
MDVDPDQPVATYVRSLSTRLDGVLLIFFVVTFFVFAAFPMLPNLLGLTTEAQTSDGMRLAYLVMPFALVGEYLWFSTSVGERRHSLLLCAVLSATAAIPFLNTLKGAIP